MIIINFHHPTGQLKINIRAFAPSYIRRMPRGQAVRKIAAKWLSSDNQGIPSTAVISFRSNPGAKKVRKEWALEVHEAGSTHLYT
jgi:hypothetical protein